ncbi:MAG: MOSC domain-containing protein [Polyangiaceae bacterium]|nr:MOSC domain-containing protein [Polyangiaceae bacterium]
MTARVSSLSVHPVKSCGGIQLPRARVESRGLVGDRRFMLVDDQGRFVTQREEAALARTRVEHREGRLTIAAPGLEPLVVPEVPTGGARIPVQIWGDCTEGLLVPEAAAWFSQLVGRSLRLVYMPSDVRRRVDSTYGAGGDIVGFADAFPLLLIAQASLDDLAARVGAPLEMRRFRPNLVVTGTLPYAEDAWRRVRVGALTLRVVKPCSRCVIPTRDPDTGEAGKEPLATLATYRKIDGKVMFGMNVIPDSEGELAVGDRVEVLA